MAQQRDGRGPKIAKPRIEDTVKANVYADNWFQLYIKGELVATDSIKFIPHNVVSVDVLPSYPMTIAVMAKDNADGKTGMEYNNTQLGDGGFILKLKTGRCVVRTLATVALVTNSTTLRARNFACTANARAYRTSTGSGCIRKACSHRFVRLTLL